MNATSHRDRQKLTKAAVIAGAKVVPDTKPLPSDQTSSLTEPLAEREGVERVSGMETAPLPVPEHSPGDEARVVDPKPPLEHVDGTVPLPSDQLTPLVSPVGTTDTSATTRAALDNIGARDDRAAGFDLRGAGFDLEMQFRASGPVALLRRDLEAAGFGIVILGADTVDALRDVLDMPPLSSDQPMVRDVETDGPIEERRRFKVQADVRHDRKHVPPGGHVDLTYAEFERYRSGTSIAAHTDWWDGEIV